MDAANFFMDAVRSISIAVDGVIYYFIGIILQTIFDIAMIDSVINVGVINDFINRMYLILGIYMLFKISFMLLNGVVNPDSLTAKQGGGLKLIGRVIISIILLIAFPLLYEYTFRIQAAVLPVLPQFIIGRDFGIDYTTEESGQLDFGEGTENSSSGFEISPSGVVNVEGMGDAIGWQIFSAFFGTSANCGEESRISSIAEAQTTITTRCSSNPDIYKYNYWFFFSGAAGIVIIIVLIGFAVDIAIRVFKLTLLRIIAPIPLISFIDEKSAKQGMFATYFKIFASTFVDLFLKLGSIYLLIFFLDAIINGGALGELSNLLGENTERGGWITVFLIIGLFFFAKATPKFIRDIFGLKENKDDGMFDGVKKAMGVGALGAGTLWYGGKNIGSAYQANKVKGYDNKTSMLKGIGKGLAATGGAAFSGIIARDGNKLSTYNKALKDANSGILKGAMEVNKDRKSRAKDALDSLKYYRDTLESEAIKSSTATGSIALQTSQIQNGQMVAKTREENVNNAKFKAAMQAHNERGYFNWTTEKGETLRLNVKDYDENVLTQQAESQYAYYAKNEASKNGKVNSAYESAQIAIESNKEGTINIPEFGDYGAIGRSMGQAGAQMRQSGKNANTQKPPK